MMETMYGGGVTDVACKLGRIMLKYRPIAPKPAAAGNPVPEDATAARGGRRAKRKVAGREGRRRAKTRRVTPLEGEEEKNYNSSSTTSSIEAAPPTVVTLRLMPETPERKESPPATPSPTSSDQGVPSPASSDLGVPCFRPTWQQLPGAAGKVLAPKPVRPAGTWVTVERVTETWGEAAAAGLRCSDEVVRQTLMADASPSFITDTWDQVTWTNAACRTMVLDDGEAEMVVALETKGRVPPAGTCGAFTCRVTVRYACRRRGRVLLVAPCDVWRMADGGLAWWLDVKAALSLGSGR